MNRAFIHIRPSPDYRFRNYVEIRVTPCGFYLQSPVFNLQFIGSDIWAASRKKYSLKRQLSMQNIIAADDAWNKFVSICKVYYFHCLVELGYNVYTWNPTYTHTALTKVNRTSVLQSFGISVFVEDVNLRLIPELHTIVS